MSDPSARNSDPARRKDGLLTTGDMARLSKNTLRTVRFYEEAGLLRAVQRTDGGHRLFPHAELLRLQLVSDLRSAGFSLDEIRDILDAKRGCACGAQAAARLTTRLDDQIEAMRERLRLLRRLLKELESTRDLLLSCNGCSADQHFPDDCGDCEVMKSREDIPSVATVLWGVDNLSK